MTMKTTWRLVALPVALFALATPFTACNKLAEAQASICCKEFTAGADLSGIDWGLSGDANLRYSAFMQAAADFSGTASGMITDVGGACKNIASDLGGDITSVKDTDPAARAKAYCALAVAQIKAAGTFSISFQPPVCTIDASVQGGCEAKCSGSASCEITPAQIVARCDPGKLSGQCSATCKGSCEGSANLAVNCEGTCSGTCEGACDGTCSAKDGQGNCKGSCSGTCKGDCRGSCQIKAGANVQCNADCTGGCSVDYKAPKCTADLSPPSASCQGNVDCSGSCKASASAKATCTDPAVVVTASGNVSASAIASLQMNLPKIVGVLKGKLDLVKANATAVADLGASLGTSGDITGSVHAAACIIPAGNAIQAAVENIAASGEASLSVFGSVGGS
jgi:hypothetical protein